MFEQQSVQPKLSRRHHGSVSECVVCTRIRVQACSRIAANTRCGMTAETTLGMLATVGNCLKKRLCFGFVNQRA